MKKYGDSRRADAGAHEYLRQRVGEHQDKGQQRRLLRPFDGFVHNVRELHLLGELTYKSRDKKTYGGGDKDIYAVHNHYRKKNDRRKLQKL